MAANLPVEYYLLEEEYAAAKSREEKIRILEKMLPVIPQHKASQKVRGEVRRKISILKKEVENEARKKKGGGKKGIKKEGAAQVCLVGLPNTGKSYIMNTLCNKKIASTEIPFETADLVVGMLDIEGVKVQLIEIPSVHPGFYVKRGEIRGILNSTDAYCFLVNNHDEFDFIKKEMDINKKYIITNSHDHDFKKKIWQMLDMIKVYTKEPGKKATNEPVALKKNATVADLGDIIHKDFIEKFRYAKVIRLKDKVKERQAGLKFKLEDNDTVEFKIN